MKIVVATQRLLPPDAHGEVREGIDVRWRAFLGEAGLALLPLPNAPEVVRTIVRRVKPAGIILTGGGDLSSCGSGDPEREETEAALLDVASTHRLPLIGICRGMQVLLEASGVRMRMVAGHVATRHALDGSSRTVNSYHRFGAPEVGTGWTETARHDGVVEAMVHDELPWVGLMWHPEREQVPHPDDVAIFRRVLSQAPVSPQKETS